MSRASTADSNPDSSPERRSFRSTLAEAVPSLGLALALVLTWSSWPSSGCLVGGCSDVLQSAYSHLVGIPIGAFASALWLGVLLIGQPMAQSSLRAILALGGFFFLLIQLFLLDGFCLLCALHSGLTMLALLPPRKRPAPGPALASMAASAAVLLILAGPGTTESPSTNAASPHDLAENPALYWLGTQAEDSPWLVLSFTCGHCWTKLDELTKLDSQVFEYGPGLIFLANVNNRSLTQHILAAALSSRETPAKTLEWLVALPEGLRWQILRGQTGLLKPALEETYPGYREFFPEADQLIEAHLHFTEQTKVPMTPFLLTRNARKPEFTVEETFGPARPSR